MIVVDTSALVAVAKDEAMGPACLVVLQRNRQELVMSAVTLTECMVVAQGWNVSEEMRDLIAVLEPEIVTATADLAPRVAEVYRRWGKGYRRARLNFCDCFAYVLSKQLNCPLLFIGDDFIHTDIASALQ